MTTDGTRMDQLGSGAFPWSGQTWSMSGTVVYTHCCWTLTPVDSFNCVWFFVTLWTIGRQAPLSMGFSKQEFGSGLHALLQGIFPTQGLNLRLMSPALAGRFFTTCAIWEAQEGHEEHSRRSPQHEVNFLSFYSLGWLKQDYLLEFLYQEANTFPIRLHLLPFRRPAILGFGLGEMWVLF